MTENIIVKNGGIVTAMGLTGIFMAHEIVPQGFFDHTGAGYDVGAAAIFASLLGAAIAQFSFNLDSDIDNFKAGAGKILGFIVPGLTAAGVMYGPALVS